MMDKEVSLPPNSKVLIVEDDADIRNLVSIHVTSLGLKVFTFEGGSSTLEKIKEVNPDLLVLDWMLPEVTGIEVLRELRSLPKLKDLPVLLLTARAHENDIVKGLDSGADDYVTKPFQAPVFKARLTALLRRSQRVQSKKLRRIHLQDVVVDVESHQALRDNKSIGLTVYEFKVLLSLAENANKVLTRTALIQESKGEINVVGRTIDNHVLGLRKKLGESGQILETIRGVGYRLHLDPAQLEYT
jgi:DNA-binding response OmpR family regulator